MKFLYYYIRSMRLYYGFVTGAATLAGVFPAVYSRGNGWTWRVFPVIAVGFLAWGINQIINDYSDREEDRINAPHRPMVSGKLAPHPAWLLSCLLMFCFAVISCFLTVWTLLPIGLGFLFNLLYAHTKGIPLLGNVVYGVSLSMCTLYGYLGASGGVRDFRNITSILTLCGFLALSHFLMCLYSTLKDVEGDRAAGKKTLSVMIGNRKTQRIAGIFAALLLGLYFIPAFMIWGDPGYFIIAWGWCVILAAWNALMFASGEIHRSTKSNCQSCAAQQLLVLSLYSSAGLVVMLFSWLAVELLFRWYPDEKE
ncbi:MAG: prenyltransferase [Lentisphaerae bacterium ADurb.Bin242]|nr:MAG: prenyltransferase [Lentisphaerae bacterium ADurb.Bin242]